MSTAIEACRDAAVLFTRLLAARSYGNAYAMTSQEYRAAVTLEQMREGFETFVPPDWGGAEPIEAVQTMDTWPTKRDSDLLWVYVSIGGDVYSEALAAVLTSEGGDPKVREVEFGRP